ncbi:MAG TPA: DUF885 domain-containing protein [Acidimicrobiales bacterium]|jgi:uncharacterized protein (DUF885 family)|nr:DUF885 domain-containing protein [Acidimicrobiales bacterium]
MTTPRDLADRFHARWLEQHPLAATSYGIPGYDHLMPDTSAAGEAEWRAEVEQFASEADRLDAPDLEPADEITLHCMREAARQEVAVIDSAGVEYTVTAMPFADPASFMAVAARTVLVDADAAHAYLERLALSGDWIDQVSERLRAGAAGGRLPIAPLVTEAVGWGRQVLAAQVPEALLSPTAPAGWDGAGTWEAERRRLAAEVTRPALARWVDTVEELLPRSRPSDRAGLAHLPGGQADYARAILTHTTLPVTAEQLHQTGLDQIATLERAAVEIGSGMGLDDLEQVRRALRDSAGRISAEDAIREALVAVRRAEAKAAEFFPAPLPPPCDVTPMPPIVAASGVAPHYTPPRLDGGRPGTFWFNTERPTAGTGWDIEVVAFHEAVPGHHLQLSRLQKLDHLPALQRQRSLTVFSEGWGLYTEQLADEVGLYTDDRARLGAISASLMRAARLVVDTGLHHYGWSREQARAFFIEHVPMPAEFLAAEIDRYLVMPGQALAYMTGKLEILALRDAAMARMGDRFTLSGFHAAVLDHGSLPMPVLRRSIERWSTAA